MKKRILSHIALVLFLANIGVRISAAPTSTPEITPTPSANTTPNPTESDKTKRIDELKERLATKVAELKQSQRMAVYGTIQSVSVSTFTVETSTKNLKIELTDDIKIFQKIKGTRTELKIENLEKNDIVTVFGEYDQTLELLKAKVVFIQSASPVRVAGTITGVSKTDYTITIQTTDGKTYIIDNETTTKTSIWNGKELEKGGFSKLTVGDTIHIIGTIVPKKENRISAIRITNIGNMKNENVNETITPKETQATTSATTTPTTKASPTAKP